MRFIRTNLFSGVYIDLNLAQSFEYAKNTRLCKEERPHFPMKQLREETTVALTSPEKVLTFAWKYLIFEDDVQKLFKIWKRHKGFIADSGSGWWNVNWTKTWVSNLFTSQSSSLEVLVIIYIKYELYGVQL